MTEEFKIEKGIPIPNEKKEPAPDGAADDWKQAIDDELVLIESTVDSYPTPKAALSALLDWHVSVALDPQVSDAAYKAHYACGRGAALRVADALDEFGRAEPGITALPAFDRLVSAISAALAPTASGLPHGAPEPDQKGESL